MKAMLKRGASQQLLHMRQLIVAIRNMISLPAVLLKLHTAEASLLLAAERQDGGVPV
jgi:hypothetical protein